MKQKKLFFYTLFFVLILICKSYSNEIVIVGNAFKGPKIWQEGKECRGILVDILKYVGEEMDIKFKIELYPWARAYALSTHKKVGIIGLSVNKERLKIFDYSKPLYYDEVVLVVKRGNEFKFESNEDLKGKLIGSCRGCSFGPEYEEAKKFFKLCPDDSNSIRLRKLLLGRIDAAIISPGEAALNFEISKMNLTRDKFSIITKPINKDPNHLGFAKSLKMKDFLSEFNQVIRKAYKTGAIQKIIAKY